MSFLYNRMTIAGVILCLFALSAALNVWQRWSGADIKVYVTNATATARLVRVTDTTSGRRIATYRAEARTTSLVVDHRLDEWWQDPRATQSSGRGDAGLQIELLATTGCAATATSIANSDVETVTIDADGLSWYGNDDLNDRPHRTSGPAAVAEDPCDDGPAPAVGVIANQTTVPIVVGGRVLVRPCSKVVVRTGDLTRLPPASSAATAGATSVAVSSLDVQGRRWPLEPRAVVVTRYEVVDDLGSDIDPDMYDDCSGLPLADHDEMYPPDDDVALPPDDGS